MATQAKRQSESTRTRAARLVVAVNGGVNLLTGLTLLFAPRWFYENVADFPPFNRHFLGDIGALTLALGFGLVMAARNPRGHRGLIGIGALGGLIHAVNHLYDDLVVERGASLHWATNTLPVLLMAASLLWAWRVTRDTAVP